MNASTPAPVTGRILLLRGLTRESGHWGEFCAVLQETLPDWSLLTLDLPGTGSLFQKSPGTSVPAFADEVLAQLDRQPPAPTVVLGMSLGGMVALEMLGRGLDALVGGIFINTSEASLSKWNERISPRALVGLLAALASPSLRAREGLVHRLTSINAKRGHNESQRWVDIARARPVAKKVLAAQIWAAARYRAPSQISQPLLWLASEQDRFVDLACTRRLWERFGGDMDVYPFAGHDLTLDAPQWTARRIRRFLDEKIDPTANARGRSPQTVK